MRVFKFLFFLCLLSFNSIAFAYDCNFGIIKPGVTKKDLGPIHIYPYGGESSEFQTISLEGSRVCNDSKGVDGLIIQLLFKGDKLVKVNYTNTQAEPILFEVANKDYKTNFKRNEELVIRNLSEFYNTDKNGVSYFYVNLKNGNVENEHLEILSKVDSEKIDDFFRKAEEVKP